MCESQRERERKKNFPCVDSAGSAAWPNKTNSQTKVVFQFCNWQLSTINIKYHHRRREADTQVLFNQ